MFSWSFTTQGQVQYPLQIRFKAYQKSRSVLFSLHLEHNFYLASSGLGECKEQDANYIKEQVNASRIGMHLIVGPANNIVADR